MTLDHHSIVDIATGAFAAGIVVDQSIAAADYIHLPILGSLTDLTVQLATAYVLNKAGSQFRGGIGEGIRLTALLALWNAGATALNYLNIKPSLGTAGFSELPADLRRRLVVLTYGPQ